MNRAGRLSRCRTVAAIAPRAASNFPLLNWTLCGTNLTVVTVAVIVESLQRCTNDAAKKSAEAIQAFDDAATKRLDDAVRVGFPQKLDADSIIDRRYGAQSSTRANEGQAESNLGDAYEAVAATDPAGSRTIEQRLEIVHHAVLNAVLSARAPRAGPEVEQAANGKPQERKPRSPGSKRR